MSNEHGSWAGMAHLLEVRLSFVEVELFRAWNEHLSETFNWQYDLWDVLMLQAWMEHERQDLYHLG